MSELYTYEAARHVWGVRKKEIVCALTNPAHFLTSAQSLGEVVEKSSRNCAALSCGFCSLESGMI